MQIVITKISDEMHKIEVFRRDGTHESAMLNSRSFIRHDFAHFAVESAVPIMLGYWGMVASGMPLAGDGLSGADVALAESLAGPTQTLMRHEAGPDSYLQLLQRVLPERATLALAENIHDRARSLLGNWKATPFGGSMSIAWDLQGISGESVKPGDKQPDREAGTRFVAGQDIPRQKA